VVGDEFPSTPFPKYLELIGSDGRRCFAVGEDGYEVPLPLRPSRKILYSASSSDSGNCLLPPTPLYSNTQQEIII